MGEIRQTLMPISFEIPELMVSYDDPVFMGDCAPYPSKVWLKIKGLVRLLLESLRYRVKEKNYENKISLGHGNSCDGHPVELFCLGFSAALQGRL